MAANAEVQSGKKITELRVVDLKEELEKRGLEKNGVKATLIERLKKALEDEGQNVDEYTFDLNTPTKKHGGRNTPRKDEEDEAEEAEVEEAEPQMEVDGAGDVGIEPFEMISLDEVTGDDESLDQAPSESGGGDAEGSLNMSKENEKKIPVTKDVAMEEEKTEELVTPQEKETVEETTVKDVNEPTIPMKTEEPTPKKLDVVRSGEESKENTMTNVDPPPNPANVPVVAPFTLEDTINLDTSSGRKDDDVSLIVHVDDTQNDLDADILTPIGTPKKGDPTTPEQGKLNDQGKENKEPAGTPTQDDVKDQKEDSSKEVVEKKDDTGDSTESKEISDQKENQDQMKKDDDKNQTTPSDNKTTSDATKSSDAKPATKVEKDGAKKSSSSSRNLWVSGLSSSTRATDLKALFSKNGKVAGAKIVTNAKSPGARCYGFVTMSTAEEASKCIQYLHRTELHGKMISVERAKNDPAAHQSKPQSTTKKSDEGKPGDKKDDKSTDKKEDKDKKVDDKKDVRRDLDRRGERRTSDSHRRDDRRRHDRRSSGHHSSYHSSRDRRDDRRRSSRGSSGDRSRTVVMDKKKGEPVVSVKSEDKDKKEEEKDGNEAKAESEKKEECEKKDSAKEGEKKEETAKDGDKKESRSKSSHRSHSRDRHSVRSKDSKSRDGRSKSRDSRRKEEVLSFDKIKEERERERLRQKERAMRERERRRIIEMEQERQRQMDVYRRQKEEAMRLERERERLREERLQLERERIRNERERIEREREQRERERAEREREDARLEQIRISEQRRAQKRAYSGRDEGWGDSKRASYDNSYSQDRGRGTFDETNRPDPYERRVERYDRRDGRQIDSDRHDSGSRGMARTEQSRRDGRDYSRRDVVSSRDERRPGSAFDRDRKDHGRRDSSHRSENRMSVTARESPSRRTQDSRQEWKNERGNVSAGRDSRYLESGMSKVDRSYDSRLGQVSRDAWSSSDDRSNPPSSQDQWGNDRGKDTGSWGHAKTISSNRSTERWSGGVTSTREQAGLRPQHGAVGVIGNQPLLQTPQPANFLASAANIMMGVGLAARPQDNRFDAYSNLSNSNMRRY